MAALPATVRIDGDGLTIGVAVDDGLARLVYIGPLLAADCDLATIAASATAPRHESQPDRPVPPTILPQSGKGYLGTTALDLRRGDHPVETDLTLAAIIGEAHSLGFRFRDERNGLLLDLDWRIGHGDVVRCTARIENIGDAPLAVDRLAALVLPLPRWATAMTGFSGRWSGEMHAATRALGPRWADQSRGGKPGFGGGNWLLLHEADATADHGRTLGAHLAWSGDYDSLVECDGDGSAMLQLGPRLDPGEVVLAPGECFATPEACFAFAASGRNGLRHAFHSFVRTDVLARRADWPPRRVHINSWDALGFALDEERLIALAQSAGDLGVERFVLDDGWFAGRRDDRSSLGDWTPDRIRFPRGLDPLIDAVERLRMDFGLWVEPEMVSRDSDLYRAHPDWCLHVEGLDRREQRAQLVLDLARPEVAEHVFGALDTLLARHRIAYLKWDHNRDLFPLASPRGRAGYGQARALHGLLDRLRGAHPAVEIETCASGGGRIDFALLRHCHRIWPSDNNDPVERLRINAAWSQFLPAEIIGSHIGPARSPQTGRVTPIELRAMVAIFGHMGIEADPAAMSAEDRAVVHEAVAVYKAWRAVIHGGRLEQLSFDEPGPIGLIARGEGRALAIVARGDYAERFTAAPVRFAGFEPDRLYRVSLPRPWPDFAARTLADPEGWTRGKRLPGRALAEVGLALPLIHPGTGWLVAIEEA